MPNLVSTPPAKSGLKTSIVGTSSFWPQGRSTTINNWQQRARQVMFTPVAIDNYQACFSNLVRGSTGEQFGTYRLTTASVAAQGATTITFTSAPASGYWVEVPTTSAYYNSVTPLTTVSSVSGNVATLSKALNAAIPAGTTIYLGYSGFPWVDIQVAVETWPAAGGPITTQILTFSKFASTTKGASIRTGQISPQIGAIYSDPLPRRIPAGYYALNILRLSSDGGAGGSYQWPYSHGGAGAFAEGNFGSTPTVGLTPNQIPDITTGVGVGLGGQLTHTINSTGGVVNSIPASGGGQGYTSASGATALDPMQTGYGLANDVFNLTNGVFNGSTYHVNYSPGVNYSALTYTGLATGSASGYGSPGGQQSYGPCLQIGTPTRPIADILCIGDSKMQCFGAITGSSGDHQRRWSKYENALSLCGVPVATASIAESGSSIASNNGGFGIETAFIQSLVTPTNIICNLGTNDGLTVNGPQSLSAMIGGANNIISAWRNAGTANSYGLPSTRA